MRALVVVPAVFILVEGCKKDSAPPERPTCRIATARITEDGEDAGIIALNMPPMGGWRGLPTAADTIFSSGGMPMQEVR